MRSPLHSSPSSPSSSPSSPSQSHSPSAAKQAPAVEQCREIPVGLIQVGDVLKVLPGAQVPADGTVVAGSSFVDEAMITGESAPVAKKVGATVFGSTTNQGSVLYVRADADSTASALQQIVKMIEAAQISKPPSQDFADRLAELFTPFILIVATVVFAVWAILGENGILPEEWFSEEYGSPLLFALLAATSVVVISCPCALGLATPTAVMVGTSVGASNGILIKSGAAFEAAHNLDAVIFDKTGTLTEGKPKITDIQVIAAADRGRQKRQSLDGRTGLVGTLSASPKAAAGASEVTHSIDDEGSYDELDVLRMAATAERDSEHAIAAAIRRAAQERHVSIPAALTEEAGAAASGEARMPGRLRSDSAASVGAEGHQAPRIGVEALTREGTVRVGSREFMEEAGILVGGRVDAAMWDLEVQGKTVVLVALDTALIGIIAVADRPKDEAYSAVAALQDMGVEVWMVTGDQRTTAYAIADDLNIPRDKVVASAMPMMKVSKVEELQQIKNGSVAMVGDGMNDSPALSLADIGIAIGEGTKLAVDAADMVLVRNNLLDVVVAVDIARLVFSKIKQNFFLALVYNSLAIPFAAGILFPWTHTLIPPQYAGLMMALSSVSVVLNSLSLNSYRRPESTLPPEDDKARTYLQLSTDEEYEGSDGTDLEAGPSRGAIPLQRM